MTTITTEHTYTLALDAYPKKQLCLRMLAIHFALTHIAKGFPLINVWRKIANTYTSNTNVSEPSFREYE